LKNNKLKTSKNITDLIPNNVQLSDLFYTAIEKSPNIVFITDINGIFKYINSQFSEITGYKLDEIKNKTPRILKSGKQNEDLYKELWQTITLGEIWKGNFINKDKNGIFFWDITEITPIISEQGKITNFLAVKKIITQEKQIEKVLKQNIEKFKNVFDFINDTVTIHDFSGKMLAVNKAFCDRLGYTYEEAMQLKPEKFDAKENSEKFVNRIKKIKKNGFVIFETLTVCKDGSTYYTEVSSKIINFEDKKAFLGIGRDITKRKKIIKELNIAKNEAEASAKMQASFLANMSHEIRTPMNGILGFTDLLKNNELPSEKRIEYLDIIDKSGKHLLNLINDIIDISKIDSGQTYLFEEECKLNFCLLDISKFFNEIIKEKSENKVELIVNYGIAVGKDTIIADETKLRQIITNLIGNAIKFTKKGTITVNASIYENEYILISVKDTGIGITKESQSVIFERFRQADESTTRHFGGTGLGLAISQAYVEMMGGKIWVESEEGKGSTFYFTIKYKNPQD